MKAYIFTSLIILLLNSCNRDNYSFEGDSSVIDKLKHKEMLLWKAVHEQDSSLMSEQLAPDYKFFSDAGDHDRTRKQELSIHFSGMLRLDSVRFDNWRSSWLNKDAIVFHYTTKAWGAIKDSTITQVAGAMAAWRNSPDGWKVVARTEWLIPDEIYLKNTNPDWIK